VVEGILLLAFGFIIGYMVARRTNESDLQRSRDADEPELQRSPVADRQLPLTATMLREIDSEPFAAIVDPEVRQRLRDHYLGRVPAAAPQPVDIAPKPATITSPSPTPAPAASPAPATPVAATPPRPRLPLPRR
jgi:hypothetical protein